MPGRCPNRDLEEPPVATAGDLDLPASVNLMAFADEVDSTCVRRRSSRPIGILAIEVASFRPCLGERFRRRADDWRSRIE